MSDKFGDQLPRFRIPHSDHTLWPAAGDHRRYGPERIYRPFGRAIPSAGVNIQYLPAAIQIPQVDFVI